MKRALTLLAVVCLALTATACVYRSNREYYERAQLYLGNGDFETAAELFSQLGEYEDAADYALYANALAAVSEDEYALARADLTQLGDFKSAERYLRYLDALEKEEAGELAAALEIYESLGSFCGSDADASRLRTEIPERSIREARTLMAKGEYEAARTLLLALDGYGQSRLLADNCTDMMNKAAYAKANALCESGDHLAAMEAFLALGEALDAPARAEQCRAALFMRLNEALEQVTLNTAAELIAAYEAINDPRAAEQAAALNGRYGVNLALVRAANSHPYVLLGEYPVGESGAESALLWRVIALEGAEATLLCETVIDAAPVATITDLCLTEEESAAVLSATLPAAADLASLSDLTCAATPYALAQGVGQENGLALYWLRDSLESGVHPVVSGSGALVIPADECIPGVRPMLTISLEEIVFTAGTGTAADPFR